MIDSLVRDACESIRRRVKKFQPRVGLILGSGLGTLADLIQHAATVPYDSIPGFPVSHVSGHAGNLVLGFLGTTPVVAMQGRSHLYEGWSAIQATLPLRCMHSLGIESVIISNASGGINPRFESGQVVLIDNHIDMMNRSGIEASEFNGGVMQFGLPGRKGNPYDADLMRMAEERAIRLGFSLAQGTYLATLGPNYETRAEYRFFAKLGADMVGMSTVPEVSLACHLGLRVLAFSIITNVAKPDAPNKTDHAEVLDWSRKAQWQLIPLIQTIVKDL
ncbi:MAG: purine-nucleoside phosphorylase [Pirellula sp.]